MNKVRILVSQPVKTGLIQESSPFILCARQGASTWRCKSSTRARQGEVLAGRQGWSRKCDRDRNTHSVEQVVGQAGERGSNAFGGPPAKHTQPHGRENEEMGGYRRRDAIG
jgi:hypothetical protein